MSAEGHFHLGSEPAEPESIGILHQERRLRQVHFSRNGLMAGVISWPWQNAHRRWISGEGSFGESINVEDGNGHFFSRFQSWRR